MADSKLAGYQITVSMVLKPCPNPKCPEGGKHEFWFASLDGTDHRGGGMTPQEAVTHLMFLMYDRAETTIQLLGEICYHQYDWKIASVFDGPDDDADTRGFAIGHPDFLQHVKSITDMHVVDLGFESLDDNNEDDEGGPDGKLVN